MRFLRNVFYAVAIGAILGLIIRERRERRQGASRTGHQPRTARVPPVIGPPPLPRQPRRRH
jgi:hypothetical protein